MHFKFYVLINVKRSFPISSLSRVMLNIPCCLYNKLELLHSVVGEIIFYVNDFMNSIFLYICALKI